MTIKDQEWANELRRSDERANELRRKYEELVQAHLAMEERLKSQDGAMESRESEILRLGKLYQGGQNMDQLAQKYQQETNERNMQKLQNQCDFLNKENHRIQTILDITMGDRTAVDHMDLLKREVGELTQENGQLRSDLREMTVTLKDFQEIEYRRKEQDRLRIEHESIQQQEINQRLLDLENEKVKTQEERNRAEQLRAAFNADKKALQDKISVLDHGLKDREERQNDVMKRVTLMEQNDQQQRSELNFWNGKVTNMKRDLDFQQDFNVKLADENRSLRTDVDCLKTHLEMRDKEHNLLHRQIAGLHEDNERMAKMYQLVQNVREGKSSAQDQEVAAPCHVYEQKKLADKAEQNAKKGWQVASEDMGRGGGAVSSDSLANTIHFHRRNNQVSNDNTIEKEFEHKITIKRND